MAIPRGPTSSASNDCIVTFIYFTSSRRIDDYSTWSGGNSVYKDCLYPIMNISAFSSHKQACKANFSFSAVTLKNRSLVPYIIIKALPLNQYHFKFLLSFYETFLKSSFFFRLFLIDRLHKMIFFHLLRRILLFFFCRTL